MCHGRWLWSRNQRYRPLTIDMSGNRDWIFHTIDVNDEAKQLPVEMTIYSRSKLTISMEFGHGLSGPV